MAKEMTIDELWEYLDKEYKYIIVCRLPNYRTSVKAFLSKPESGGNNLGMISLPIQVSGPYDTLIERPASPEDMVGMFGKFWDGDKEPEDDCTTWGYLAKPMTGNTDYPFRVRMVYYAHFRPCLPKAKLEEGK